MTKPCLLVVASTYPRWPNDHEPAFVHELSRRLTDRFSVHVLCPRSPGAFNTETMDGVIIHRFAYAPRRLETLVHNGGILGNLRSYPWKWLLVPGFFFGMAWKLLVLFRQLNPHRIHAHWLIPQGLVVALLRLLGFRMPPFLVTAHGGDLFALRGRWSTALKRFVIRQAIGITVVSTTMREEAKKLGADPNACYVIPMGVDFDGRFKPDPSVTRTPGLILFVGRLVEKKGVRYLIEAMPLVLRSRPDARLQIAGYGPEEADLKKLTLDLELTQFVEFLGPVQQAELPTLYRQASVLAAPFVSAASGDQEGLPVVVMEAIGCGCPVVAGYIPGIDDIFKSLDHPFLLRVVDAGHMAEKVIRVLSESRWAGECTAGLMVSLSEAVNWAEVGACYSRLLYEGTVGSREA